MQICINVRFYMYTLKYHLLTTMIYFSFALGSDMPITDVQVVPVQT